MRAAMEDVVIPAAERFQPDFILVGLSDRNHAGTADHSSICSVTTVLHDGRPSSGLWRAHANGNGSHFPDVPVGGCAQVSAGYDAHWRDPLAGLQMRTATFHRLAAQLHGLAGRLCGGRLVLLLEGGYDLRVQGPASFIRQHLLFLCTHDT